MKLVANEIYYVIACLWKSGHIHVLLDELLKYLEFARYFNVWVAKYLCLIELLWHLCSFEIGYNKKAIEKLPTRPVCEILECSCLY